MIQITPVRVLNQAAVQPYFAGRMTQKVKTYHEHLQKLHDGTKEGEVTLINTRADATAFGLEAQSVRKAVGQYTRLRTMNITEIAQAASGGDFAGLKADLIAMAKAVPKGQTHHVNCTEKATAFSVSDGAVKKTLESDDVQKHLKKTAKLEALTRQTSKIVLSGGDFEGLEAYYAAKAAEHKTGDPPIMVNCAEAARTFDVGDSTAIRKLEPHKGKLRPMSPEEAARLISKGDYDGLEKHLDKLAAARKGKEAVAVNCADVGKMFDVENSTVLDWILLKYQGRLRALTKLEVGALKHKKKSPVVAIPSFRTRSGHLKKEQVLTFEWHVKIDEEPYSEDDLRKLIKKNSSGHAIETIRYALSIIESGKTIENPQLSAVDMAQLKTGTLPLRLKQVLPKGKVELEFPDIEPVASREVNDYVAVLTNHAKIPQLKTPKGWTKLPELQLKPFQIEGFSWLKHLTKLGFGVCLADAMGLGKTAQALALIQQTKNEEKEAYKPSLVVVPKSLLKNWNDDSHKFTPGLKVGVAYGKGTKKADALKGKPDVVLTTYDTLFEDYGKDNLFFKKKWSGVFLDEAQRIKNIETSISSVAKVLRAHCEYPVLLTGTPMENHVGELFALVDFLNPGWLGSADYFKENYFNVIHNARGRLGDKGFEEAAKSEKVRSDLKKHIAPFILRRVKTDTAILKQLEKSQTYKVYRHQVPVVLSGAEHRDYQTQLDSVAASLPNTAAPKAKAGKKKETKPVDPSEARKFLLLAITRLRQRCNHPYLVTKNEADKAFISAKQVALAELLKDIVDKKNEKALIFTQSAEMGKLLQEQLRKEYPLKPDRVLFFHGGLSQGQRHEILSAFDLNKVRNKQDASKPLTSYEQKVLKDYDGTPEPSIMILTTKAGNAGLNLQSANHVIHYDPWWNPAVIEQANGRVDRMGQKNKEVHIYKFTTQGTIEERIERILQDKADLFAEILTKDQNVLNKLKTDDLEKLLSA